MILEPVAVEQLSAAEKRSLLTSLLEERRSRNRKVCPVSFSQRRLWFLDQLAPGSPFYNVDCILPISRMVEVDVDVFDATITQIIQRHEILRTTFESVDGEPVQVISTESNVRLQKLDLRNMAPAEQDAEAARFASEQATRPFDLARGPLMRIALVKFHDRGLMILVMHHIICDGWSMGVFLSEFQAIYQAFLSGSASPLPELTIQYADFAAWQRHWLQGEILEKQLDYWKKQLEGIPVLNLPCDRARPAVQTFRGAYELVSIPKHVVDQLKDLGKREGATLFMVLLSAFHTLLCRYSGQDDIAVGTYIANRNRAEVEQLIGFFINTLVMRTHLQGNPPFSKLLAQVKETALAAYAHQDTPFEMLVENLQPERDLSRNPLVQVVFQLFNAPNVDTQAESDDETIPKIEKHTAIFDIAFSLWETSSGLGGGFEYSTDLFDPITMQRMARHYNNLLEGIARDPSLLIWELPLLSGEESRQIIMGWNATTRDLNWDRSIMDMFRDWVASHPQSVALIDGAKHITYSELDDRVCKLAHHLKGLGAGVECLVGICLERSVDAVAAVLATFAVGAAYVPMDPTHPSERLEFIVRDANIFALITRPRFAAGLPGNGRARIDLDAGWDLVRSQPSAKISEVRFTPPDALAYAIYTSGSTGKPKGVAVEHRQILNRLMWMWREYPFAEDEVGCQKTELTFVDSLWELLGPLLQGIPSIIVAEHTARDPRELLKCLAAHGVSRLWLVPALLRELLNILESDVELRDSLRALRFWVSSGEALFPQLAAQFVRVLPEATLYNLYGTSEIWDATWHDPCREAIYPDRSVIGRPIDNVQAFVLAQENTIAPVGVVGELCISGIGLARGYLNRPELTSEKFVPHPLLGVARLYRTGDAARYLRDGQIEYLGRMDRQLKIRGYRVEPGEVEAILASHHAIREAAVIGKEGPSGTELLAYLTVKPAMKVSVANLIDFLQGRVPHYMVPTSFIFVDDLPKTTSGKLNRMALPAPENSASRKQSYVAPRTTLEAKVVELYQQVLGLESVSVDDHFFRDLGGHSLLATRLSSRVRTLLNIEVPLQTLFEAATPSKLAQVIEMVMNNSR
jgi:amino acid adenylation domain-containing protein